MKQFSTILNVILLVAVAFLYFKVFSNAKSKPNTIFSSKKDSTALNNNEEAIIAYVELDSLNENITYIKDHRKDLEKEQKAIETEWRGAMTSLQNRAAEFQKNAGAKTQQDAEKLQNELGQLQQQIEAKKQSQTQALSEKSYDFLEKIQKELKACVSYFNKDKRYKYIFTTGSGNEYMIYKDDASNITKDVTDAMNIIMKDKK
jgi:outer membrane protein